MIQYSDKLYKNVSSAGKAGIALGIISIVSGIVIGIMSIVYGGILLSLRKQLID